MLAHGFNFDGPDWLFFAFFSLLPVFWIGVPGSLLVMMVAAVEILGYGRLKPATLILVRAIWFFGAGLAVYGLVMWIAVVTMVPKDKGGAWFAFAIGLVVAGLARICLWRGGRPDSY